MDILGTIKGLATNTGQEITDGLGKGFSQASKTKEVTNSITSNDLTKAADTTGGIDIATSDENCKENITSSYDQMRSMLAKMRGK